MIESLLLGSLSGAIIGVLNFFCAKLFPAEKFLKMNWTLKLFFALFLIFLGVFVLRMCYVLFLTVTGVEKGSTADYLFRVPMQWLWAGSLFFFFLIPILKARRIIK